jgi:hypothetical protein
MSHSGLESLLQRGRNQLKGTKARLGVVGLLVALIGGGVYASISVGDERESTPVEQLEAEPTGPGRFGRAYGMSVTDSTEVFMLGNGAKVSVAETATAKCLFAAKDGGTGELCDRDAAINEGKAVSVTDECGTTGENRMEITGLAPIEAAKARLNSSDDSSELTSVEGSAFRFEGSNPSEGAAYPTGVSWLRSNGSAIITAPLPVNGDEFCRATS